MQQSCGACPCRQHTQVAQSCHDVASSTAQRPWLAVHAPNNTPLQCPWTHTFRCLYAQMPQQIAAIHFPAHCHQDSLQTNQHKGCCRRIRSHTNLCAAQKSSQALTQIPYIVCHQNTVQQTVCHRNTCKYMCVPRIMQVHVCHQDTCK